MKKIISKVSRVLHMVLMAPVKLPGKALTVIKYVALGLGIIDQVLDEESEGQEGREEGGKDGEL